MRRILHFMSDIHVSSGMATVVMNYYRHVDRSRIQFDFLCFEDGSQTYAEEIQSMGGRVFLIPRPAPSSVGAIRSFFREHQDEFWVLHCHPVWSAAILGPIARRYGAHAIFLHSHSEKPGESSASILRNRLLLRLSAGAVDRYLACSHAAETALMGIPDSVHILPNAIDTPAFRFDAEARRFCRSEFGIAADAPVVGNVGRMVDVKNQRFLLESFALCRELVPAAQLLLVGSGPLEPELRSLAARLRIQDCVHFSGVRQDTARLYSAMDVFAMPSLFEGLSMALLEAQASGLPCVVSDTISPESEVTDLICRLPLNKPHLWADVLADQLGAASDRTGGFLDKFSARNLDIHSAAKELTALYESV